MLRLMEHVADKTSWERDIFDEKVVAQWYADAALDSHLGGDFSYEWDIKFDRDLISTMTWNWCIQELRDKALMFTQKGHLPHLQRRFRSLQIRPARSKRLAKNVARLVK
ncbi:hypothetical protein N7463_005519 [Penicillium fimorum]|uniref:DUF4246 domain-containing protein n=1 Tax=Penicillium fimorum TaxID=1882269 RepID=A0A9W9XSN9_9EURO|nr:hypothetical protein N7463_005519 [Penicillium fimorum]